MCVKLLLLLLLLTATAIGVMVVPCVVQADTSAYVTITAMGFIIAPPSGFTVTYISDNEIHLSWINPPGSMATMIRADYGEPPVNMTDGYLVYNGAGADCSDTTYSTEEAFNVDTPNPGTVYYRAWSQRNDGVWGNMYIQADTEDIVMISFTFLAALLIPIALVILTFMISASFFRFLTAGAFAICSYWLFHQTSTLPAMDYLYQGFGYLWIGGAIMMPFARIGKNKVEEDRMDTADPESSLDRYANRLEKQQAKYKKMRGMGRRKIIRGNPYGEDGDE